MSGFAGAPTRRGMTLEAVRSASGTFDIDAFHVMEERDNTLIAQEILHGSGSSKFVYAFEIQGKQVAGISVVGARELARQYGGIKHRLVASVSKIGSLFQFTSFPHEGVRYEVTAQHIDALAEHDDYYEVLVEIADIKTGNTVQVRKRESSTERRRDGSRFERPHYSVIAESKAYRNGVLSLVDQGVQLEFKMKMLALGKSEGITDSLIDEKRSAVLRFSASNSVPINRRALEALTLDQLAGLGDAARTGGVSQFRQAAETLRVLDVPAVVEQAGPISLAAQSAGRAAGREAAKEAAQPASQPAGQAASKPAAAPAASAAPDEQAARDRMAASQAGPAPAKVRAFVVQVADEDGAMMEDQHGEPLVFRNPGEYLRHVADYAADLSDAELATLLENNSSEIEDARKLDAKAAADFDTAITRTAPAAAQQPDMRIDVPQKSGRADLVSYLAAVVEALSRVPDAAGVQAWHAANVEVLPSLPTVTRKNVMKAIESRLDAIRGGGKGGGEVTLPLTGGEQPREHRDDFAAMIAQIRACETVEALTALSTPEFTERMTRLTVDQQKALRTEATARRAALAGRMTTGGR